MQQCRNEINMMGLLNQFIYVEKEHITKRVFLWDRGRNNVLTGTLKLKIPWNLQTCKELTPILHLVINTLQRKRLRTNFKPNGSTIFKVYQNFGHIFSLNPVEIHVTLDLPEHSMSPLTIYFLWTDPGRYRGEAVEDRICMIFNLNKIESEKYFLLHCPFFNKQRSHSFHKI